MMDQKQWKKLLNENTLVNETKMAAQKESAKLGDKLVIDVMNEAMTADENYKDKVKQISNAMKLIKFKIAKHNSQQRGDPENWGFAGDLGYVIEQMQDIISFLSKKK